MPRNYHGIDPGEATRMCLLLGRKFGELCSLEGYVRHETLAPFRLQRMVQPIGLATGGA
jgi:hypothetical protein